MIWVDQFTVQFGVQFSLVGHKERKLLLLTLKWPQGPGGGALPYMGYIGTCRGIGYGFWRLSILK